MFLSGGFFEYYIFGILVVDVIVDLFCIECVNSFIVDNYCSIYLVDC